MARRTINAYYEQAFIIAVLKKLDIERKPDCLNSDLDFISKPALSKYWQMNIQAIRERAKQQQLLSVVHVVGGGDAYQRFRKKKSVASHKRV
jgi:hypothetical protein